MQNNVNQRLKLDNYLDRQFAGHVSPHGGMFVSMSWQHGHHQKAPGSRRVVCLDEVVEWCRNAALREAGLIEWRLSHKSLNFAWW